MFSSGSFIVLGFTFRSVIHFELIFIYVVHMDVPVILAHLLKRLSFFQLDCFLHLCQILVTCILWVCFQTLYCICIIDLFVYYYTSTMLFWSLQLYSKKLFWLFQSYFGFLIHCIPIWILVLACQFLQKHLLAFWLGLPRVYRSVWGELISQ